MESEHFDFLRVTHSTKKRKQKRVLTGTWGRVQSPRTVNARYNRTSSTAVSSPAKSPPAASPFTSILFAGSLSERDPSQSVDPWIPERVDLLIRSSCSPLPPPCHPTSVQLPSNKKGQPQALVVRSNQPTSTVQQSPIARG